MISISIIGSGNVAQHLISALYKAENIELVQVYSRNPKTLSDLLDTTKIVSDYKQLKEVDLYLIAVSDDAIATVSVQLPFANKLVVHTSGSVALEDLSATNRKGVFYPLQTFTKNKEVNFKEIPLCLEAQNETDLQLLKDVAFSISDRVFEITSEQRKPLHAAAVFVNNFVNHLYIIGNDICKEHNVPFEILKPLIKETANKIETLSPEKAQTGPAKRKDTTTINKHLAILTDANQKEIYKILTKSIIDNGKL
ncbi:Rossmann-like and DUF2520 domain-containing protein [Flavobacterium sp.]|uniref:Rossmann-like and DUF2520 domain-containing protein n=1 Tax=Flavobacterium sp. TaxID=239 RepID=UPI003BCBAD75